MAATPAVLAQPGSWHICQTSLFSFLLVSLDPRVHVRPPAAATHSRTQVDAGLQPSWGVGAAPLVWLCVAPWGSACPSSTLRAAWAPQVCCCPSPGAPGSWPCSPCRLSCAPTPRPCGTLLVLAASLALCLLGSTRAPCWLTPVSLLHRLAVQRMTPVPQADLQLGTGSRRPGRITRASRRC